MGTIKIRGREYTVERILNDKGEFKDDRIKYKLTGKRGAVYYTMRNVPNPKFMFVVPQKFTTSTMDRVWLTDDGGELRVVSW
jgi:hypothetical protein